METLIIILITLTFGLIVFNILNNKKFSFISFLLFIFICLYYYLKYINHNIYITINENIQKLDLYTLIIIFIIFVISIIEYIKGYKRINNNIVKEYDSKNEECKEKISEVINENVFSTYFDMFDEPIAMLKNDCYLINNEMKKILKYNSNIVDKKKFLSFVHLSDRNTLINSVQVDNFRLNINGDYQWFECINHVVDSTKYVLIRKINYNSNNKNKVKLQTFKDMISLMDDIISSKKEYYLIFFNINNYTDFLTFYGNDFTNLIVNKHLNEINKLSYVTDNKIFYISKNEYAILIDNILEYNILLSELENNSSILIKNDIIISDNKISVRGKIGTITSSDVKNKNSSNVVNKGLELLKLAIDEDYNLDYAIYHETDENIEYPLKDLDIDLNFDFTKYKKRLQ